MKIFIHEIKKILRPIPLLILTLFAALFGYLFIELNISYLTTVHMSSDQVALTADLAELVGTTLEPEEVEDAVAILTARYISEIETEIASNPLFAAAGVTDYEGFKELQNKLGYSFLFPTDEESDEYLQYLEEERQRIINGETEYPDYGPFDPDKDYTLTAQEEELRWVEITPAFKLQLLPGLIGEYERIIFYDDDYPDGQYLPEVFILTDSKAVQERIMNIYESGAIKNILPGHAVYRVTQIYFLLVLMVLASVAILLAPVITKDNMSGVTALQYSSKTGRKTLTVQLLAMLFTAFVVAVIASATVFGVLIGRAWHSFLDTGLNSFADIYSFNLFSGNYGQYFLAVAGLVIAMSLAAALFMFLLSKLCRNYISLILGLVPMSGALIFISYILFKSPFALTNNFVAIDIDEPLFLFTNIPYTEVYVIGLLLIIGGGLAAVILKRQKRTDV